MGAVKNVIKMDDYLADKMVIAGNIRRYLKDPAPYGRFKIMNVARNVMKRYGKRRMDFGRYTLQLDLDDVLIIKAKQIVREETCPNCKRPARDAKYLRTQVQDLFGPKDLVTQGCTHCGEVFARRERNERGGGDIA